MGRDSSSLTEEWRSCHGADLYEVSNLGRVRSWNNNRWGRRITPILLKLYTRPDGYFSVNLGRGVVRTIHSLVCEAFHGERPVGMEAAHRNGVQTDNRSDNLRWATPLENAKDQAVHGTKHIGEQKRNAKLTAEKAIEIRALRAVGTPYKEIARQMSVAPTTCCNIAKGRKWKHLLGACHGA